MKKIRLIAGGTVAAVAMSITGLTGVAPASAQEVNDVAIIVENAPIALSTIGKGVENALNTYDETQSFEAAYKELWTSNTQNQQGAGAGVRSGLADLFWGISIQGAPNSGSAVGFVLVTLTGSSASAGGTATAGATAPIVAYLDDQQPLVDFLQDPTALNCRDVVVNPTRSYPCEIMSVAQAQAIVDKLPGSLQTFGEGALECVAKAIDGNVALAAGCPAAELFTMLIDLENAYEFRPNVTPNPWTPLWAHRTNHAAMIAVSSELGAAFVPEDLATAINDLTSQLDPILDPVAEALRGLDLNGDGF